VIDVGDPLPLSVEIRAAGGALDDPGALSVTVTLPDGSTAAGGWTSVGGSTGALSIVRQAVGLFSAYLVAAQSGSYSVAWVATGANASTWRDIVVVQPATPQAAVSLDELRQHLGVSVRVRDDQLRALALVATEAAEDYAVRWFRPRQVVEQHTGGRRVLVLRRAPAVSVVGVAVDGQAVDGTLRLSPGGLLYHPRGYWPDSTPYGIEVTYLAGAAPVAKARHGILELARHLWETQRGGSNLPRQSGAESEWDPRAAFSVPRRVAELLDGDADSGIG
jgi:hypothetical protein